MIQTDRPETSPVPRAPAHQLAMPEPKQAGRATPKNIRAIVTLAALPLVAWSVHRWNSDDSELADVVTTAVVRGELPVMVIERGELESSNTIEVRCEVEGEQIKISEAIPDGSRVTKGQDVLKFDTDKLSRSYAEQEVKWRTADAKAKAAQEDLAVAKNKAESEVAKAQLAVKLAKIDLRKYVEGEYLQEKRNNEGEVLLAEEELRRAEQRLLYSIRLQTKGYVSETDVEADRVAVTKATNTLNTAKEKVRVLEEFSKERKVAELSSNAEETERELERTRRSQASAIAKAESDFHGATATAAVEKTLLEKLKQQLDRCVVSAPADGILVYDRSRPWDTSSRIQSGGTVHFQRVLFTIPDLNQMQVKVKIHESSVKKVSAGQVADIRVDAYSETSLQGTVEKIATLAENRGFWDQRGVKEYESIVKIRDIPADAGLKPGMTAEIKIHVSHLSDVLLVPIQAVAESGGKHVCFVVIGNSIDRREVTIGENNEKFVEIQDGLVEGDQITLDARARVESKTQSSEPGVPPDKPAESATIPPPPPASGD